MQYKIFGCKVNKFYINKRLGYFSQNNLSDDKNYLIATCVVTDRAKNKRLKDVQKNLQDGKKIYITGCGVFDKGKLIDQDKFYSIYPELQKFQNQIFLIGEDPGKNFKSDSNKTSLYTKKFILIQNGCDNFCTFCLTIMKRGKHRSRPLDEIIDEINEFSDSGGKEIVLTGINLAARGCDNTNKTNQSQFNYLLQEILNQTTIPRIRISSIGPEYLDDTFFHIIENPRIMPHFHISIQHFSDNILKSMNRNYDSKYLISVLQKFQSLKREVPVSVGADLIIGFPGETESDFQTMLDGISDYNITKVHAFPFSGHTKGESVPAGKYDNQIIHSIKLSRKKQLNLISDQVRNNFIEKNKGLRHSVLIEEKKDNKWQGRTENYIQVKLDGDYKKGEIIQIKL
ncbi:MiaB/RimO family radical SAM methylthiotransferase [Candidatus Gracilibacteria bacterium]|nr:MiaB/RimO family radical SAM methylthiotransferase [Candidatus Gracilibacteria bacterium]